MENQSNLMEDLKFIRQRIEAAGKYTNIPAFGYFAAGILGLFGCYLTYFRLGRERLQVLHALENNDVIFLAVIWAFIFVLSVSAVVFFSILNARRHRQEAWTPLAARLFLSKIPIILSCGIFTIALNIKGQHDLIPALWLLGYSIIVFSFSYFTGVEHKIQGIVFFALGVISAFSSGLVSLLLLAIGFGMVNIFFGIARFFNVRAKHGTEEA